MVYIDDCGMVGGERRYSFKLDVDKGYLEYSNFSLHIISIIRGIVKRGDTDRKFKIDLHRRSIKYFLDILKSGGVLEFIEMSWDDALYQVSCDLTEEKLDKVISFEGVLEYFRSLDFRDLPSSLPSRVSRYIKPCVLCCGEGYRNSGIEDVVVSIEGRVISVILNGESVMSLPVVCCPVCGRKI